MKCFEATGAVEDLARPKTPRPICIKENTLLKLCEISSSHGGEYDVQSCLLGYTAV
jgi:hypothetical protein